MYFLSGCTGTYLGTENKVVIDEGQELLYLKETPLKDCKKACDTKAGCNSFTFGKGGHCYLKDRLITTSIYRLQITTKHDHTTYYCSKGNLSKFYKFDDTHILIILDFHPELIYSISCVGNSRI